MRSFAYVLSLALVSAGLAASVASAQTPDVHALLRLRTDVTITDPFNGSALRIEATEFVSRGGYTFLASTSDDRVGSSSAVAGRGFAETTERNILREALTRYRIGFQVDCRHPEANRVGYTEVIWNGRGERRNQFTVYFGDAGPTDLPPCAPEIELLLLEIGSFVDIVVLADEFFTSN